MSKLLAVLSREHVQRDWERIRQLLPVEDYCYGELHHADLLELVTAGLAVVLALREGATIHCVAVVEVLAYPRRKVLNVIMVGGTGIKTVLRELHPQLAEYAQALGCDALRGQQKFPAMVRLLKQADPRAKVLYQVTEIPLC